MTSYPRDLSLWVTTRTMFLQLCGRVFSTLALCQGFKWSPTGGLFVINVLQQLNFVPYFLYATLVNKKQTCGILLTNNIMQPPYIYSFVRKSIVIHSLQWSHIFLSYFQHSQIYTEYKVETHLGENHKVLSIWNEQIDAPFICALSYRLCSRSSSLTLYTFPSSHSLLSSLFYLFTLLLLEIRTQLGSTQPSLLIFALIYSSFTLMHLVIQCHLPKHLLQFYV